jgi:hypothetical protein
MKKLLKAFIPRFLIQIRKNILINVLTKKWKKNPIVKDWIQKGWIDDNEIGRLVFEWEKTKSPVTPPHKVKQMVITEYSKNYNCSILVETGTYKGDMMAAQRGNFKRLYSIELSEILWEDAVQRFKGDPNIILLQGDSSVVLKELAPKITESAVFWLDGHYCGEGTAIGEKECPIYDEIQAVFKNDIGHVMLIDDARCFVGERDYPTISELTSFVKKLNNNYKVTIADDIIRIVK